MARYYAYQWATDPLTGEPVKIYASHFTLQRIKRDRVWVDRVKTAFAKRNREASVPISGPELLLMVRDRHPRLGEVIHYERV